MPFAAAAATTLRRATRLADTTVAGRGDSVAKALGHAAAPQLQDEAWVSAMHRLLKLRSDPTLESAGFHLLDLRRVEARMHLWVAALPRVRPFFAVKSNSHPAVIRAVAESAEVAVAAAPWQAKPSWSRAGFDAASASEIRAVGELDGVVPDDIIFAHPCKAPGHLSAARHAGVNLTVADSKSELDKIGMGHPDARVLIRVATDDAKSVCKLSSKFGAHLDEVPELLRHARLAGVNVVGISFHVGSGAGDPSAFANAVSDARKAFDMAADQGTQLSVLDVGGGFPGSDVHMNLPTAGELEHATFEEMAVGLRGALDVHFPVASGQHVEIIAEPGRYFVEQVSSLATPVIGRRTPAVPADEAALPHLVSGPEMTRIFIGESLYGAFNSVVYDHAVHGCMPIAAEDVVAEAAAFAKRIAETPLLAPRRMGGLERAVGAGVAAIHEGDVPADWVPTSIWGHTCDGLDCVVEDTDLPTWVGLGDWLLWPNTGAYGAVAASRFNGFDTCETFVLEADGTQR